MGRAFPLSRCADERATDGVARHSDQDRCDDRRTALDGERAAKPELAWNADGSVTVGRHALAQQILRSRATQQDGFNAALVRRLPQRNISVLFLDGEAHRRQRAATARFFTPSAVATRYRGVIGDISADLVGRFRRDRRVILDEMTLDLAAAVAAEIVGLTDSVRPGLGRRLARIFALQSRAGGGLLGAMRYIIGAQLCLLQVYLFDVRPAIRRRRRRPGPDLISSLLDQGWSSIDILAESIAYATAGLSTTREFIVVAALHLLENEALRTRFLDGDEDGRLAILGEILRLEPAVSTLLRRTTDRLLVRTKTGSVELPADTRIAIDIRSVNADPAAAGACPFALRPDRDARGVPGLMSFGDGAHRCPGASVALHEAAILLDALLRVPGIRIEHGPTMSRSQASTGYLIRDVVLAIG